MGLQPQGYPSVIVVNTKKYTLSGTSFDKFNVALLTRHRDGGLELACPAAGAWVLG